MKDDIISGQNKNSFRRAKIKKKGSCLFCPFSTTLIIICTCTSCWTKKTTLRMETVDFAVTRTADVLHAFIENVTQIRSVTGFTCDNVVSS